MEPRSGSPSLEAFRTASHYAVNIPAADQEDLSALLPRAPDKFGDLEICTGFGGAAAAARLLCLV